MSEAMSVLDCDTPNVPRYGDITCGTEVGRVFQLMFLAVGLVS